MALAVEEAGQPHQQQDTVYTTAARSSGKLPIERKTYCRPIPYYLTPLSDEKILSGLSGQFFVYITAVYPLPSRGVSRMSNPFKKDTPGKQDLSGVRLFFGAVRDRHRHHGSAAVSGRDREAPASRKPRGKSLTGREPTS